MKRRAREVRNEMVAFAAKQRGWESTPDGNNRWRISKDGFHIGTMIVNQRWGYFAFLTTVRNYLGDTPTEALARHPA